MEVAVSVVTSGLLVCSFYKWQSSVTLLQLLFFSMLPCFVSVYLIQHRVLATRIHALCHRKGAFYVQIQTKHLIDKLKSVRLEFVRAYITEKQLALKRSLSERASSAALAATNSSATLQGTTTTIALSRSAQRQSGLGSKQRMASCMAAPKMSSHSLKTKSFGSFASNRNSNSSSSHIDPATALLVAGNGKSLYKYVDHQLCDHQVVDHHGAPVYFFDTPSKCFLKVNKQRKLVLSKDFSASCLFHLARGKTHHYALLSSKYQCFVGQNLMQRVVVHSKKLSNWEAFRVLQRRVDFDDDDDDHDDDDHHDDHHEYHEDSSRGTGNAAPPSSSSPAGGADTTSSSGSRTARNAGPVKSVRINGSVSSGSSTSSGPPGPSRPSGPLKPILEESSPVASPAVEPPLLQPAMTPPSPSASSKSATLGGPVIHLMLCSARFGKGMWLARDPDTNVIYFSKNYTKALCLQYHCDLQAVKSLTQSHHQVVSKVSSDAVASSRSTRSAPLSTSTALQTSKPCSSNPPAGIGATCSVLPPPSRKNLDSSRSSVGGSSALYTKHLQLGVDFHQPILTSMEVPRLILPWVAVSEVVAAQSATGRLRGLSITSRADPKPPVRFFELSEKELKQVSCKSFMDVSCREVMNFFMDASTRQKLRTFTRDHSTLSSNPMFSGTDSLFPTLTPTSTEPGGASEWHWFEPMNSFFRKLTCRVPAHGVSFRHASTSTSSSSSASRSQSLIPDSELHASYIGTELVKATCMDIYHGVKFYPVKQSNSSSTLQEVPAKSLEEEVFHLAIFKSKLFNLGVPFSNSFSIETSFEFSDFRCEQEEGSVEEEDDDEDEVEEAKTEEEEDPNRRVGLQVRCWYGVIYTREVTNSLRITIEKQVHQGVLRACDKLFELLDQAQKKKRSVVTKVANLDSFLFQLLPPHTIDMEILAGMVHAIPHHGTQATCSGTRPRSSSRSSGDGGIGCPGPSLKLTWEPFVSKSMLTADSSSATDSSNTTSVSTTSQVQTPVLLLESSRQQFQLVYEKDLQFAPAFAALVTGLGASQMTMTPQFIFDVLFSDSSVFENSMGLDTTRSSFGINASGAGTSSTTLAPYADISAWTNVAGFHTGSSTRQDVFMRQQQLDMKFEFSDNKLLKPKPVVSICTSEFFGVEPPPPSSPPASCAVSSVCEGAFEFGMKMFMDLNDFVSPTGMMVERAATTTDESDSGTVVISSTSRVSSNSVNSKFSVEVLISVGELPSDTDPSSSSTASGNGSTRCEIRCMVAPAMAVSDKSQSVPFSKQIDQSVINAVQELGKIWTAAFCQAFPYRSEHDNKLLLYRDHRVPSYDEIVRRIAGSIVESIASSI